MGDFLEQIPVVSSIVKQFPSMDFEGQRLAEKLYQWIVILFAVVGFIWGFVCQQFAQTIYILGAGVCLAFVLIIPPWNFFRRTPLNWQPPQQAADKGATASSSSSTGAGSARKKDRQRN